MVGAFFSGHRLGSRERTFDGLHFIAASTGRFFWISFYHCGCIAGTERERWQWIVDGIHRWFLESAAEPKSSSKWCKVFLVGHKVSEVMEMHAPHVPEEHFITNGSRSGGSPTRSTVLSRGPGRPRSRTADTARLLKEIPRPSSTTTMQPKP